MKLPWSMSQHLGGFWNMGLAASPKLCAGDLLGAAIDVLVIEPDVGPLLNSVLDDGIGERQCAGDPLIVVVQRGCAEHHLLDPVGGGPAGGCAGLDADAPGGVAVA